MFQYVHHVHYVVHNRDAMVDYLEKTFGMKPDNLEINNLGIEAQYNVGETQIQITEPTDLTSTIGRHLTKHGPGVFHVAWGVDNLRKVVQELAAKGNKGRSRGKEGTGQAHKSGKGYLNFNIDPATSHGVWFQLVGPE